MTLQTTCDAMGEAGPDSWRSVVLANKGGAPRKIELRHVAPGNRRRFCVEWQLTHTLMISFIFCFLVRFRSLRCCRGYVKYSLRGASAARQHPARSPATASSTPSHDHMFCQNTRQNGVVRGRWVCARHMGSGDEAWEEGVLPVFLYTLFAVGDVFVDLHQLRLQYHPVRFQPREHVH